MCIRDSPHTDAIKYDSLKTKRILPSPMSQEKLQQISRWGDKEPKFAFGLSKESSKHYLLRNEMFAKNNKITLEEWNTNPEHPKFLGIEIKDLYSYFMVFVALSGLAAIILFVLSKKLSSMMHGVK